MGHTIGGRDVHSYALNKLKRWKWSYFTLCPNYIQVLPTAYAVGQSWACWTGEQQDLFYQRWSALGLGLIGAIGLPGLLRYLLTMHRVAHFSCVDCAISIIALSQTYFATSFMKVGIALGKRVEFAVSWSSM